MIILGLITAWLLASPLVGFLVGRALSRGWNALPDEAVASVVDPARLDPGVV